MTSRQKQKVKVAEELKICEKCGSVMITRKIAEKNGSKNGKVKFITILQCIVCRHWTRLNMDSHSS